MTTIQPPAPSPLGLSTGRARGRPAGGTGFVMADMSAHPAAAPSAPLDITDCRYGLLSLQDDEMTPDEQGRRRARSLLARLTGLQVGLLGGGPALGASALDALRTELAGLPAPADPRLRDVLAAIALRVEVELARRGQPA